ncbi:MAG: HDIG domain-containing metalloprotein [Candidatus Neomarinimicrobiota bacterium]
MKPLFGSKKSKNNNDREGNQTRRILIFTGLTLILSLFFPRGKSLEYNYNLDDITREEIVAQFSFPILKEENKLQADMDEKIRSTPYLFARQQEIVNEQTEGIESFFRSAVELHAARERYDETQSLLFAYRYTDQYEQVRTVAVTDSAALSQAEESFRGNYPFDLSNPLWKNFIQKMHSDGREIDYEEFKQTVINICRNRWAEGIFDIEKSEIKSDQVAVDAGDVLELFKIGDFNDLEEAWGVRTKDELRNAYPEEDNILSKIGYDIVVAFMKPNVIFNKEKTEERKTDALAKVPRYQGIVMENERIVDANTRVTREVLLKLDSYRHELDKREKFETGLAVILPWVGRILLVGVILSFFFTFLRTYRRTLFEDNKMLLLFGTMYLLMVALAYVFVFTFGLSEYLVPVTVVAMVVTVLFDARIAVMAMVALSILIAFIIGNKLDFVIVSLFTSVAAIYAVRKLRTRAQLFSAILYIVVGGALAIAALGMLKRTEWTHIRYDFLFIGMSGILAPFITFGLSALLEIVFGVTSDLTLLELSDFNHPLLKRLSKEANGTFNHCVVVGNMVESCANALKANPLLCRVGAYYHDIGKLMRPEYFVENQLGSDNKHDNLSATLSARIITSHVKDGLKLAREYRLPPAVSDFIPMHHGTDRIEYFYQKAVDQANGNPSKVNESDFCYSGPKPDTKETGILMICEAVEATVRSLKNPDLRQINATVTKIIEKRLKDGQLDNCPLTMRDLARMRGDVRGGDGLLPVLRGIYHLRIEYPDQKKIPSRPTASA